MISGKWVAGLGTGCLFAASMFGQDVVSVKAGLVHYTEGDVFIAGEKISPKVGDYPEVKEGQELTTETGRVEVLLSPGVVLRIAENSGMTMISSRLSNAKVKLTQGSAVLEANEILEGNTVHVVLNETPVEIRKTGVYRFDAGVPARVKVYDGEIAVLEGAGQIKVKDGKQVILSSVPTVEKLAKNDSDSFLRWVSRRSGYLAVANVSAANYMRANDVNWTRGGWYFNSLMGMFTYIPYNGRYTNYWNYGYYSPQTIMPPRPPQVMRSPSFDGFSAMGASARGMQDTSGRSYSGGGGYSSPSYQAPATASGPAAPVASGDGRGASSGGSRGGGGSGGR